MGCGLGSGVSGQGLLVDSRELETEPAYSAIGNEFPDGFENCAWC
jgi:hypothetical protein